MKNDRNKICLLLKHLLGLRYNNGERIIRGSRRTSRDCPCTMSLYVITETKHSNAGSETSHLPGGRQPDKWSVIFGNSWARRREITLPRISAKQLRRCCGAQGINLSPRLFQRQQGLCNYNNYLYIITVNDADMIDRPPLWELRTYTAEIGTEQPNPEPYQTKSIANWMYHNQDRSKEHRQLVFTERIFWK